MIDNIKLYLPDFESKGGNLFDTLARVEQWHKGSGTNLFYTKINGYRFALNVETFNFLYIYFSPYKLTTNGGKEWQKMTGFAEVVECMQMLEGMGLDLSKASICSLEVGATLPVTEDIEGYFTSMGEKKGYRRIAIPQYTTLYYNHNKSNNRQDKNTLKIYSKSKERGEKIKGSEGVKFARIECKFRQRKLNYILPSRRANELLEPSSYLLLLQKFLKEFESIKPTGVNRHLYTEIKSKITGIVEGQKLPLERLQKAREQIEILPITTEQKRGLYELILGGIQK